MNREFFDNNLNNLTLDVEDKITIYFGSKGMRYYTLNNVNIVPKDVCTIILNLTDFNRTLIIDKPTIITQIRKMDYTMGLQIGDEEIFIGKRMHFYEGSITVEGPGQIIQTTNLIYE
jgi:glutamate formiminotransferase